jgi:DNA-binding FadR family transcriptional regulator
MSSGGVHDIASLLKHRISQGEWKVAGKIPPERDLASEYNVARNTLRKAIDILEKEGLLRREVGRGSFITEIEPDSLYAIMKRMEGTSPADLMEIRRLIEPAASSYAATNASISELEAVRESHLLAVEAKDMPTFEKYDAEFHHRIFECCRNDFLKEIHNLIRTIRNQSLWVDMKKRSFSEERRLIYCNEHQAILDCLLKRNPEGAKNATLKHLNSVQFNLLGR